MTYCISYIVILLYVSKTLGPYILTFLFWCWQFTERSLAHELLLPTGGPTAIYHIAYARLKLQKHELDEAEESLNEAMQFDHQVIY